MDTYRISTTTNNPLEKIRLAEAESSYQITMARKSAEQAIIDAHQQAAKLKEHAKQEGRLAGEKAAQDYLNRVQSETRRIAVQAQIRAEEMSRMGVENFDAVVKYAVSFVIGLLEQEEEK